MFRKIVLGMCAAALLGAAAWKHYASAGIEDPPVCGPFAPGMVDEVPGGVAGGPGTGLNFATGFEPEEGYPLGYISNAGGTHPLGCGGPAFPCWGHTTAATASLITPTIENLNAATGVQHLRLIHDPSTRTNQPGLGLGVDARYPRAEDRIAQPTAPNTISVDFAISGPGGQDFRIQPQSNSQGCMHSSALFFYTGGIYILDDVCGTEAMNFQPTGFEWDTTGAYQNYTTVMNPYANTLHYYYGGQLIYSSCLMFGSNVEEFLVFGDNYPGSHMDVDNIVVETLPPVCGDGVVETNRGEQCEPGNDSNCPGRCIAQGGPGECTCTPICPEEEPCPLQNGANGPYLTSSGWYSYTPTSPFVSIDTCGSGFNSDLDVMRASDLSRIVFETRCLISVDASASCAGTSLESCVCFSNPGEPVIVRVLDRGNLPPTGSGTLVNIRKKSVCAGDSVGACCDTNGPDQGCTDNVTATNCMGADKVFTDQGKCDEVTCECFLDCTGATCGDDGCGGSCGTCGDGNVCNGEETCVDHNCAAGTPLNCNDGNACNGFETCNPSSGCIPGTPLNCTDGDFCNGLEICVPPTGCFVGTPPCADDETCDEDSDQCVPNAIPTVGEWGLVILALAMLVTAKVRFRSRTTPTIG